MPKAPKSETNPPISPETDAPAVAAAPDPNELVSIFNRNPPGGDFVHHIYEDVKNGDGTVVQKKRKLEWRARAREFANVPRWVAELWKHQSPATIVDGSQVSKGAPAPAQDPEVVKALVGENADLKTRLSNMEKMVEDLRKAQLSGATPGDGG
jgi:hypothetical protein